MVQLPGKPPALVAWKHGGLEGVLPHRKSKRQFLQPASRGLQSPEDKNAQAFFSGFSPD